MKIGVLQFAPAWGKIEQNLEQIENLINSVNADLLVLPELCTTGYQFIDKSEVERLSVSVPDGRTTQRLATICKSKNMHIVAGLAEKDENHYYNSAVLVGPEGHIGTYRKIHLFAEEKQWFSPGNTGFQVWDIGIAKIGIMICFDWIFPESARTLAMKGADIICHPANLVLPWCPDAMVTRSIENRIFTATANRIGQEKRQDDGYSFIGMSQVTSTKGEILFRLKSDQVGCQVVDIDPEQARNKNITSNNHLWNDRRTGFYDASSGDKTA